MGQPRWTTTSDQYLSPSAGDAWAAEAAAAGERGSQRILDVETVPALPDIAAHLGLPAGTPVVIRRRLILADDKPVEIATSHWPASIAEMTVLADPAKVPGGTARFVGELGYIPAEVREDVTARWSTPYERTTLHLEQAEPVLKLTRILLDDTGQPYQCDINVMRAGRHIRYVRQAG
ncbi:UTRA domain-containing protein [Micromonospora sp. NBC_01740]|uniref:GntR family transcriptional regulator n=1 Tax=Micromonospora sp. NBC_01740 TaxID=2975986 RepID=UPI002E145682|nr:UTRA domain-containing protein [Micromonospora sp. NBC_01740]